MVGRYKQKQEHLSEFFKNSPVTSLVEMNYELEAAFTHHADTTASRLCPEVHLDEKTNTLEV